jgi:hypothetical protein
MHKRNLALLALCVVMSLPLPVYAAAIATVLGDENCDVDDLMTSNRQKMDEMSVGIYKTNLQTPISAQIENAPSVKDAACLPILDTLDSLIRLRIPSTGSLLGGLMAKIRDMACKYANDYIASVTSSLKFNVSDPYGIASVGVGATTGSTTGTQVEAYDFSKVVADAVANAASQKANEISREAARTTATSIPGAANDRTPRIDTSVSNAIKDATNGL